MSSSENGKLNYKKLGSGEPVFILHGLFGMLDNWMRIGKWLSERYTVFLVDQRNHGKSAHFDSHNYDLMALDLKELVDETGFQKAHFLGHSMGAKTVMRFSGNYPDLIKSAILVDMSPLRSAREHEHIFDALFSVPIHQVSSRQDVQDHLLSHISDQAVVAFLMKNLARKKEGGYRWKMNLSVIYRDLDRILEAIELNEAFEGPVLSVKGEDSYYVSFEDELALFQLFPHIEYESISGAGHWVHADKPKEFYDAISRFIKKFE